jgi:ABC-type uncharacterized transport system involved in gliding motility auxiliary subunit
LEGNFPSLYANRITPALQDSVKLNTGKEFSGKGIASSKQIIIADADILTNKIARNEQGEMVPMTMGMLPYDEFQFANKSFYLNAISYLNEPAGLLDSRNKTIVLRILDKQKLTNARLYWQIAIVLGPLFILALFFVIFTRLRKKQFAVAINI